MLTTIIVAILVIGILIFIHELGHSLGLPYCNNRRCIMSYINNIFDLDNRLVFLCRKCQLNLERLHPGILKFIV